MAIASIVDCGRSPAWSVHVQYVNLCKEEQEERQAGNA